jgi:glycine C-acetyltransferase
VQLSAAHTEEQVRRCVTAFTEARAAADAGTGTASVTQR